MRNVPVMAFIRLRLKILHLLRAAKIDSVCFMEAVAMGSNPGYGMVNEGDWPSLNQGRGRGDQEDRENGLSST